MSKASIYFLIFFSIICCKSKNKISRSIVEFDVKIVEIDSLNNVYIYNCSTKDSNDSYRILAKKREVICQRKIEVNKLYKMKLEDLSSPIDNPQIKGFWFNNTRISIRDKNNRTSPIYTTKNINGLCYMK